MKDFPECQNGLACLYDLIKRAIIKTLVWLECGNYPKPQCCMATKPYI